MFTRERGNSFSDIHKLVKMEKRINENLVDSNIFIKNVNCKIQFVAKEKTALRQILNIIQKKTLKKVVNKSFH